MQPVEAMYDGKVGSWHWARQVVDTAARLVDADTAPRAGTRQRSLLGRGRHQR
jgi:hypothetical protein